MCSVSIRPHYLDELETSRTVWPGRARSSFAYRSMAAPRGPLQVEVGVVHGDLSCGGGRYLFAITSTPRQPPAPTVVDLRTGRITRAAEINPQVADWAPVRVEVVQWQNAEGHTIEGILTRTPHAIEGHPAPLLVFPHGGPDSVSMLQFNPWSRYFAARGYHVFQPNYRGGLGYGHDFYAANRGRLGEIEAADIESGVDHLIARGIADPAQLFFGGWSWGGYLAAWTLTHSDR